MCSSCSMLPLARVCTCGHIMHTQISWFQCGFPHLHFPHCIYIYFQPKDCWRKQYAHPRHAHAHVKKKYTHIRTSHTHANVHTCTHLRMDVDVTVFMYTSTHAHTKTYTSPAGLDSYVQVNEYKRKRERDCKQIKWAKESKRVWARKCVKAQNSVQSRAHSLTSILQQPLAHINTLSCGAGSCNVLQRDAVCCSVWRLTHIQHHRPRSRHEWLTESRGGRVSMTAGCDVRPVTASGSVRCVSV